MNRLIFIILFLVLSLSSKSQILENIFSEQDGDKINIYYTISDATPGQTFTISVSCATEGRRFVLQHVSGDVGGNITPGKNKKIVWDVLKEVDQLESAEFFVKIEKVNEPPVVREVKKPDEIKKTEEEKPVVVVEKKVETEKPAEEKPSPEAKPRKLFFAWQPGTSSFFGASIGSLGKVGFYSASRFFTFNKSALYPDIGFSITLGPSFRIKEHFHFYAGFGYGLNSKTIYKGEYDFTGTYVGAYSGDYAYVMNYAGSGLGDYDQNGTYVGSGMGDYYSALNYVGVDLSAKDFLAFETGIYWDIKRLVLGFGTTKVGKYSGVNILFGFSF